MPQTHVIREAHSFSVSQIVELWTLDGTAVGLDEIYRLVNGSSCNFQPIVFNGVQYIPFPIRIENVDMDGKGSLPHPKLTVSNINGFVSNLILQNTNLDGATVTRTRVHSRYLDAVNFPTNEPLPSWVTPDPTATYAPEPWQINRKITENQQVVQWELSCAIEVQGVNLPRRTMIANTCSWKYRQAGTCNYSGAPVSDIANRTFTGPHYNMTLVNQGDYDPGTTYARGDYVTTYSTLPQFSAIPFVWVCATNGTAGVAPSLSTTRWIACACAKTSASCKLRYSTEPLRTSAFAGISRAGWVSRK